nr:hypothetical protein [Tanacetum cinerariifolium]
MRNGIDLSYTKWNKHGEKDKPSISCLKPVYATTEFVDEMDFALDIPIDVPATIEMVSATKYNFDEGDLVKFQELLLDAEKPLYEGCPDIKDDEDLTACQTCGISRWKVDNKTHKVYKNIPAKVMWYFPIIPRLQQLFKIQSISKYLRWHATWRITNGVLRHPADLHAWRIIDEKFSEIVEDPRNLRLGISADENHWLMIRNLIRAGVDTYDASTKDNFNQRAIVLWTINDYPALENNVAESLVGTLLNVLGKTKDGVNARLDLAKLGVKPELFAIQDEDKITLASAGYTLKNAKKTWVSVEAIDLHISKEVATTRQAFYYGVLQEIWVLDYYFRKNPLFKCDWVNHRACGVKRDTTLRYTMVDLNNLGHKVDSFILASQA